MSEFTKITERETANGLIFTIDVKGRFWENFVNELKLNIPGDQLRYFPRDNEWWVGRAYIDVYEKYKARLNSNPKQTTLC